MCQALPLNSPTSLVSLERAKASPATPKATPDCQFIAFRDCRMAPCAKPSHSPASLVSLERAKASPATPKATPDCRFIAFQNCQMAPRATSKATQATPDCQFIAFRNCRMAPCAKTSHSPASFVSLERAKARPATPKATPTFAKGPASAAQTSKWQRGRWKTWWPGSDHWQLWPKHNWGMRQPANCFCRVFTIVEGPKVPKQAMNYDSCGPPSFSICKLAFAPHKIEYQVVIHQHQDELWHDGPWWPYFLPLFGVCIKLAVASRFSPPAIANAVDLAQYRLGWQWTIKLPRRIWPRHSCLDLRPCHGTCKTF